MGQSLEIKLEVVAQAASDGGWRADVVKDGQTIQRDVRISDPLTLEDMATCRWYLQQYVQVSPFSAGRAAQAEALLKEYPRQLLRQLPLRQAVLSHLKDGVHRPTSVTLFIDVYQREETEGEGPKDAIHQLFWETLESEELWSHPAGRVIVRRCMGHRQADSIPRFEIIAGSSYGGKTTTLNMLLVVARNLTKDPSVYNDVSPGITTDTLLELRDSLKLLGKRIILNIEVVRPGTFKAFKDHLEKAKNTHGSGYYNIVHFDMHGSVRTLKGTASKYGVLYFSSTGSDETIATPDCGLRSVIGMSFNIASSAVAIFLQCFYSRLLCNGESFAASAAAGRKALRESPMRPARYGSQRSLNDSFVIVSYEDGHAPPVFSHGFNDLRDTLQVFDFASGTGLDHQKSHRLPNSEEHLSVVSASGMADANDELHPPLAKEPLVGRNFELLRLEKRMVENRILYLSGLIGVGKTALLRYAAFIWRSTHFVQAVVHYEFGKAIIKSRKEFSENMLYHLLSQVQNIKQPAVLWSITPRSLHSYTNDELDLAITDILTSINAVIVLEDIEPDLLPLSEDMNAIENFAPLVKKLLVLAQDRSRPTQLYIIFTHRRRSTRPLELILNHDLGPFSYDLGGLELPDALELSKQILQTAGEPIDEWKSEDADWLDEKAQGRTTWKRILALSAKGQVLIESLGPLDVAKTVDLCRGFILAASIVAAQALGKFDEVRIYWKDVELLEKRLELPALPQGTSEHDLDAIEKLLKPNPESSENTPDFIESPSSKLLLAMVFACAKYDIERRGQDASPSVTSSSPS
ncbi:hypothetical protein G7Z17_g4803 [Cylindrodendrum hubeiense]|uniref:Uncharacterized protein n=1 Tax=Cylindrodendrum hubeiense TaxID=595255 RepID=A0A9P5H894_9HYPO|nr:hypothetical protein G7Z17_g4803 [Cylindrodendrum hubeiense]